MSGVYIHGMEMPKRCEDCLLCYDGFYCKTLDVSFYDKREWSGGLVPEGFDHCQSILPNCPLVPAPPHGRLIDAGYIYNAVEQRYRMSSGIEHRCERDLLDVICGAPTIIPAEEGE